MTGDEDWLIYRGAGEPHDGIDRLPPPPRWREFGGLPLVEPLLGTDDSSQPGGSQTTPTVATGSSPGSRSTWPTRP